MKLPAGVLLVYLVTGLFLWWFHALPEAEKLGSRSQSAADKVTAAPPPALAVAAGAGWKAPLGLLVLDTSGSMKQWDKQFSQALAAEIFAYFFSRLGPQECAPGQLERAHVAVVMFPGVRRQGDSSVLTWPEAGGTKPWLSVLPPGRQGPQAIAGTLEEFSRETSKWIGRPGSRDPRNGSDTPHGSAARTADKLIADYRAEYGEDANVFVVYFTDEPAKKSAREDGLTYLEFRELPDTRFDDGSSAYELASKAQGVSVRYFVGIRETPFDMVRGFLQGLELNARDVTKDFGDGFSLSSVKQLEPFVISGGKWKSPPVLVADNGHRLQTRGWGDTFYTMIDPDDPGLSGASSLSLEGGARRGGKMTLFERGMWSLSVEPYQYSLLNAATPPLVRVGFGGPVPASVEISPARLRLKSGKRTTEIPLEASGSGQWQASIPGLDKLRDGVNYEILWTAPTGKEMKYPFQVLREFDIRFIDTRNQKTGPRVEGWTVLPKTN